MQTRFHLFGFALLFLLIKVCPVLSQQVVFNRVVPPEEISWGSVHGITQDLQGYMWFACEQGLYRYDGYNFITYKHDQLNPNSVSGDKIECIYSDHNGIIWVGTNPSGLDRLDPKTGIFTHFQNNPADSASLSNNFIGALLEDHEGVMWVGTNGGGLNRMDQRTGKFTRYQHKENDSSSLSNDRVRALYEDKQGTVWIGTGEPWDGGTSPSEGGLNRLDRKTGKFTRYLHDPKNQHSLVDNRVRGIFEDSHGTFWVGTVGDGLHTMDRTKGTFEHHTYDPKFPEKLSRPPVKTPIDHITFITEDVTGKIWIGTLLAGLNCYDTKSQRITHYEPGSKTQLGYLDNSAWCAFTSREGVLWIGTFEENLYRVDPLRKNIPYYLVGEISNTVYEEEPGIFWVGTLDGLLRDDRIHGTKKRYLYDTANTNSLSSNFITNIRKDKQGNNLWIATLGGLNLFDIDNQSFVRYKHDPKDSNSLVYDNVEFIYAADEDKIWVGTDKGLDRFDRKAGSFVHYQDNSKDSRSPGFVVNISEDRQHDLWIGTWNSGGIYRLNHRTGKFKHYLNSSIASICEDIDGILWAGATDYLYVYNRATDSFSPYIDPHSGTKITNVLFVLEDDEKDLWICTSNAIISLNKNRDVVRTFGKNYGVHRSTFGYTDGFKGEKGNIIFPDQTGYYSFFPKEFRNSYNLKSPKVVLTEFRLADQVIKPGNNSPLKLPLEQSTQITLNYKQNAFSFGFAGIHFSSPEDNRHLYMLENYDNTWRQSRSERTAYYYNVPPGHYIFHVKAASSDGIWGEKTIAIIIYPPWWRTWWAYCIYGLLFIALIYSIHRFQKERLIKAERERTREKERAQAKEIEKAYQELKTMQTQLIQQEKMASLGELTAGIAHEIQNPLNFVNNFSEVNTELIDELEQEVNKGNLDEVKVIVKDIKDNEQKINHHGKRADAIVKGMLQHSRSSSGIKEPTDINALADEYLRLSYHGLRAKDKSFNATLQTDFDESIGKINIVPQDMGRVLLNLFNNAFFAVTEKKRQQPDGYEPTVSVSTKKIGDKVEIKVKDNGMGIPQKVVDKIFQPFFTTKPTGQGTGLGLSLSYDIVKAHGGEIKVETKEGGFTSLLIFLPA